jgi:hypothetical protein
LIDCASIFSDQGCLDFRGQFQACEGGIAQLADVAAVVFDYI